MQNHRDSTLYYNNMYLLFTRIRRDRKKKKPIKCNKREFIVNIRKNMV